MTTSDTLQNIDPIHQAYESLPVGVLVIRGTRLAYVNQGFCDLFKIPREAAVGATVRDMIRALTPPDEHAQLDESERRLAAGEPPFAEVWVTPGRNPGALVWARAGRGPGADEWVYVVADASEEAKLRAFTESLSAGAERLVRCREEQGVIEAAADVLAQLGFYVSVLAVDGDLVRHRDIRMPALVLERLEAAYGKPAREVTFPRAAVPFVDEALRTGRTVFHLDMHSTVKSIHSALANEIFARELPPSKGVFAPIYVGDEPLGIVAVMGPGLTPAMSAAIQLFARNISAALENARHHKRAAERLRQLQALQKELVTHERLAALGEAAAVVAHEVRNPLAAILNGLAMLRRDEHLASASGGVLAMVEEEAHRLDRLVHDLLDFTRPMEPRRAPVVVSELVQGVVGVLRERHEFVGLQIELRVGPGDHTLQADGHLLELAIENLLRNALQASPKAGSVWVGIEADEREVRVSVDDEGPGIPPAEQERIFEPFFTTRATGTGLGLPVVRRIATAHGGTVAVSSSPRGGARFEVRLPRS